MTEYRLWITVPDSPLPDHDEVDPGEPWMDFLERNHAGLGPVFTRGAEGAMRLAELELA